MAFKSIFRAFRSAFKPGVMTLNPFTPTSADPPVYTGSNRNTDPLTDNFGNQWFRNADNPLVFFDESSPGTSLYGNLGFQRHSVFLDEQYGYIGQGPGDNGLPCALFKVWAWSGDGLTAWSAAPVYLHIYHGSQNLSGAPLANGSVPDFSVAVAIPPGLTSIDFGLGLPFNGTEGGGGISLYLSSTPDTLTLGPQGYIAANWAFYDITSMS